MSAAGGERWEECAATRMHGQPERRRASERKIGGRGGMRTAGAVGRERAAACVCVCVCVAVVVREDCLGGAKNADQKKRGCQHRERAVVLAAAAVG